MKAVDGKVTLDCSDCGGALSITASGAVCIACDSKIVPISMEQRYKFKSQIVAYKVIDQPCEECDGEGYVDCDECSGTGHCCQCGSDCPDCDGDGDVKCEYCVDGLVTI